jgi:ABC-2 type transport system ATP-binding protein
MAQPDDTAAPWEDASTHMIEAIGLRKTFGRVVALDDLDIKLKTGQVAALLGHNGAGKTTFLRLISTLIRPDAGGLRVEGTDALTRPARVRQIIGLAGQHATVEKMLTGRENLEMIARLYGQGRRAARAAAADVLARTDLSDAADRLVKTYSGGMRRRLDLGASLVGRPRLLLLDEPTAGLDPESRIALWDSIRALTERGTDVLLTTQYLEEADRLAGTIAIIDHGKLIASGSARELKSRAGHDVVQVRVRQRADLLTAEAALGLLATDVPHVDAGALTVSISVDAGPRRLMEAAQVLTDRGVDVDDLALRPPTLDEVFLTLTGRTTGAPGAGSKPAKPAETAT